MITRNIQYQFNDNMGDCSIGVSFQLYFNFLEDPLVGSIAQQFINDRRTHDKIARNWTKRYAK